MPASAEVRNENTELHHSRTIDNQAQLAIEQSGAGLRFEALQAQFEPPLALPEDAGDGTLLFNTD
jgi:hypothetical protein